MTFAISTKKFIPTIRHNPCVGCGDTSGKCRTVSDSELILCAGASEIPGYRNLGTTKDGLWGKFVPSKAGGEYRPRVEPKKAIPETMLARERDYHYSAICANLRLAEGDRQRLLARGFSEEMVARFGAFSYEPNQPLPVHVARTTPGVITRKDGTQYLPAIAPGIYFPIRNHLGQIHGLAIRYNEGQGDDGKRRYGTGSLGANPSNLIDHRGEQPAAVCVPQEIFTSEIALVEGTGFKPVLLAEALGGLTIGAAGGNFGGSPIQIAATLKAKAQPGQRITLFADGGAIANPHVFGQYERAAQLIESLGYEFRIAWWGQFTKADGDADEVGEAVLAKAKRLTWAQWAKLAGKEPEASRSRSALVEGRRKAFEPHRAFAMACYKISESRGKTLNRYRGWQAGDPLVIDLAAPTTAVRGGLGSGKTHAVIAAIVAGAIAAGPKANYYSEDSYRVFVLNPTNGLCREFESRMKAALEVAGVPLPVLHFQDDVSKAKAALRAGAPGIYVACKESFGDHHMVDIDFSRMVTVIDEFSTFRQSAPSTGSQVLPELMRLLRSSKSLIALDANLSDGDALVLRDYRGDRPIAYYCQNELKIASKIKWLESRTQKGEIALDHKGISFSALRELKGRGRVAIAADSKLEINMAAAWAAENGFQDILTVSADTVDLNKQFMPAAGRYLEATGTKLLGYTPTIQSGVDIQVPFEVGIALANGVIPPTSMIQMMGRLRNCSEWLVSAPRFTQDAIVGFKAMVPTALRRWEERSARALAKLCGEAPEFMAGGDYESAYGKTDRKALSAWVQFNKAQAEMERKFNCECIEFLLASAYELVEVVEKRCDRAEWMSQCAAEKDRQARKIYAADYRKGLELQEEKRPPANDREVWDLQAAIAYRRSPDYFKGISTEYGTWAAEVQALLGEGFDLAAARAEVEAIQVDKDLCRENLALLEEAADVARRIHAQEGSEYSSDRLCAAVEEYRFAESYLAQISEEEVAHAEKIRQVADAERGFLDGMLVLLGDRLDRIYQGEKARQNHPLDHAAAKRGFVEYFTSAASVRYKNYANAEFFRQLNLVALATGSGKSAWKEAQLSAEAPEVISRWERFQAAEDLGDLFPEIESIHSFWQAIKRVCRALGYEVVSGQAWIKAEDHRLPNGIKNGKQQYTQGRRSVYFSAILAMAFSGNSVFRRLYPLLLQGIQDRLEKERDRFALKEAERGSVECARGELLKQGELPQPWL
jgi:hypothetical protein